MNYKEFSKEMRLLGFYKRKFVDKGYNVFYAEDMKDNLPKFAEMVENTDRYLKVFEINYGYSYAIVFLMKYRNSYYVAYEDSKEVQNADLVRCENGNQLNNFFKEVEQKIKKIKGR